MIYFDNAATTFPKPKRVIDALFECVSKYCGNPGRSAHELSNKSSEKIFETREAIAKLLNHDFPENVVFTMNATYALNTAIKTSVKKGEHILISDIEHNSVLRPIEALNKRGIIEYSVFNTSYELEEEFKSLVRDNTKCIVANLVSNVTGEEISMEKLSKLRQKYNLTLIIDASQIIGHKKIDLKRTPCDILCAPSHKALFGIQGSGFCVFCDKKERDSFIEGGSGNESLIPEMPQKLPEHFEAGTLPTPAIVSLLEGIKYINEIDIDRIETKLIRLSERAKDIISSIKNATLYGGENGVLSFTIGTIPSHIIADELNSGGICVRSGLHCAPLIHKKMGTVDTGTVRVSFSYLNQEKELDTLYKVLRSFTNKYC